jgi:uncharacterized membrane protein YgcG
MIKLKNISKYKQVYLYNMSDFKNDLGGINIEENVSDFAGLIESRYIKKIDKAIRDIESRTTIEIAVVTIDSLKGELIDKFAFRLFNKFGVGKKETNNGILILLSKDDSQFRIEIGLGLENIVTDDLLRNLKDNFILPSFKQKKFGKGILKFVDAVADKVSEERFSRLSITSLAAGIFPGIYSVITWISLFILYLGDKYEAHPFGTSVVRGLENLMAVSVWWIFFSALILIFFISAPALAAIICGSVDLVHVKAGISDTVRRKLDIAGIVLGLSPAVVMSIFFIPAVYQLISKIPGFR